MRFLFFFFNLNLNLGCSHCNGACSHFPFWNRNKKKKPSQLDVRRLCTNHCHCQFMESVHPQVLPGCLQNPSGRLVLTEFLPLESAASPPELTWFPTMHLEKFKRLHQPGIAPLEGPGPQLSVEVSHVSLSLWFGCHVLKEFAWNFDPLITLCDY